MALKLGELFYDIDANTKGLEKSAKKVNRINKGMSSGFKKLGAIVAAAFTVSAATKLLSLADSMRSMRRSLTAFIPEAVESNRVFKELINVSNASGSALEDVVKQFGLLSNSMKDMGKSNDEIVQFLDTMNKLASVADLSGSALSQTMRQLSNSLSDVVVDQGKFNAALDRSPVIADQLAKGLGVSVREMRKMVDSGKLLSKDIFQAIANQADEIGKKAADIPLRISEGMTQMTNGMGELVESLNESLGLTKGIASVMATIGGFASEISSQIGTFNSLNEENKTVIEKINKLLLDRKITQEEFNNLSDKNREITLKTFDLLSGSKSTSKEILDIEKQKLDSKIDLLSKDKELTEEQLKQLSNLKKIVDAGISKGMKFLGIKAPQDARIKEPAAEVNTGALGGGALDPALQSIINSLKTEQELLQESYEEKKRIINENESILAETRDMWLQRNEEQYLEANEKIKDQESIQQQQLTASRQIALVGALSAIGDLNNQILNEMKSAGKEQSAAYKALFYANKIIQVVQMTANAFVAGSNMTAAIPGPVGIAAGVAVTAAGLAQAALVAGLTIAETGGGRLSGGQVHAGKMHQVTENGNPELLIQGGKQFLLPGSKGGNVIPSNKLQSKGGNSTPNITIINNGAPLQVESTTYNKEEIIMIVKNSEDNAVNRVNSSLSRGAGSTNNALNSRNRMTRRGL
jgi:tape measure domain-containing protein